MRTLGNRTAWGGALLAAALFAGCRSTPPPTPPYDFSRAEDVVRAMHDRYFNRWVHTQVHVQFTMQAEAPDVPPIAYVAVAPPGRQRIDFEPRDEGNGVLVVSDTQYVVTGGRPTQIRRLIQPLLLLQHDVYYRNPLETMSRLRELGVQLDRVRVDRWDGRPVFVIGALARDTSSRQFWVDRELMVLVRWIEPSPRDPQLAMETRLLDYERLGSAWVSRRMDVLVGGERMARYESRQVRANITLDTLFFRPDDWTTVQHWYQSPLLRRVR